MGQPGHGEGKEFSVPGVRPREREADEEGESSKGWRRREAGQRGQPNLTAVQRRLAEPAVQVAGLAAGLPEGQVVLVVRRHPGGAQHSSQVQAQRQKDAHQPHQLQRGQHRDAHLLHAAAGRSHGAQGRRGGRAAAGPEGNRSESPAPRRRGGRREKRRDQRCLTAARGVRRRRQRRSLPPSSAALPPRCIRCSSSPGPPAPPGPAWRGALRPVPAPAGGGRAALRGEGAGARPLPAPLRPAGADFWELSAAAGGARSRWRRFPLPPSGLADFPGVFGRAGSGRGAGSALAAPRSPCSPRVWLGTEGVPGRSRVPAVASLRRGTGRKERPPRMQD